ncbi:ABC-type arginine transport system permease subunit [Paenibacillus sp. JGP012]|nr:ABC-type arginine transport system permease subunit [Paenibacillus sp. JGP012]
MTLVVRGVPELIIFLIIMAANYLIMYLVVSSVLNNSGLKSKIDHLQNEVLDLKRTLNENKKNLSDDTNKN